MNKPVLIIGAGGHAKVLLATLQLLQKPVLGLLETDVTKIGMTVLEVPIVGTDEEVLRYAPEGIELVNGMGSVQSTIKRQEIFDTFKEKGYFFFNVIHPSAILAADVTLGEGVQVMAGAVLQTGVKVGSNSIVNTRASLDHDCILEDHVHIAPGVTLSGNVHIGQNSHIGTGAVIIQNIRIGSNSLIAAGAVVVENVLDGAVIKGVPGRSVNA